MGHKVFISYSTEDSGVANKICTALEEGDVPCWMAPRDILPGMHYAEAIIDALSLANVAVLIFSENANKSGFITRELERAVSQNMHILPIRINQVIPSSNIEFYISISHWFDAYQKPIENYLQSIVDKTRKLLEVVGPKDPQDAKIINPPIESKHKEEGYPVLEWTHLINNEPKTLKLKIIKKSVNRYYLRLVSGNSRKLIDEKTIIIPQEMMSALGKASFGTTLISVDECWKAYARLGNLLYRKLIPSKMQEAIDNHKGSVVLETDDLTFPWDLLHDERSFLCTHKPFSRITISSQWINTIFQGGSASQKPVTKVLIIADPFDNQPESILEAQDLQLLFQDHGINTEVLIGSSQCSYLHIKQQLVNEKYAIIHIAGSLRYLPNRQTSALVLANEQLLMAEEVCSLSTIPFVFLNVTHGAVDPEQGNRNPWEYAPINIRSMAQAFMYESKGSKSVGVIGSMWGPMDLKENRNFVKNFYNMLLSGVSLGEAFANSKEYHNDRYSGFGQGTGFVFLGDMNCRLDIRQEAAEITLTRDNEAKLNDDTQDDTPIETPSDDKPWSDDIKVAIYGAITSMQTMNWPFLSTIHLLLGLTYLPKGFLSKALSEEGYDPNQARRSLRKILEHKKSQTHSDEITMSKNFINLIETAKNICNDSDSKELEESHVLHALLAQKDNGALSVLENLKINIDALKQSIGFQEIPDLPSCNDIFNNNGMLKFDLFEGECIECLQNAVKIATKMRWDCIRTPHLFMGILDHKGSQLQKRVYALGLPFDLKQTFFRQFQQPPSNLLKVLTLQKDLISENLRKIINNAQKHAEFENRTKIIEGDLLEAMLSDKDNIVRIMIERLNMNYLSLLDKVEH
jgi:hypothetical protein